jgi:hypothetical protein
VAVACEGGLLLGFVLVGFAFLSGGVDRGTRLAKRRLAFLARGACSLTGLPAATAAAPTAAAPATLTLAILLGVAFSGFASRSLFG